MQVQNHFWIGFGLDQNGTVTLTFFQPPVIKLMMCKSAEKINMNPRETHVLQHNLGLIEMPPVDEKQ